MLLFFLSWVSRIVYKDFMRHFVLNLKSGDDPLTRPKLPPSKIPVRKDIFFATNFHLHQHLHDQTIS